MVMSTSSRETLKKVKEMDLAQRNKKMALFIRVTGKKTKQMDLAP
jgi:hypothetical protein